MIAEQSAEKLLARLVFCFEMVDIQHVTSLRAVDDPPLAGDPKYVDSSIFKRVFRRLV